MRNKVKTYCFTCLILTFILTLLRLVSLFNFYDVGVGYFNSSFITTLTNVIYLISSLWCLSSLIFIPKSSIETQFTPNSLCVKGASAFAAVLFIFSAIFMCGTHSKFASIIMLTSLISTLFFIFSLLNFKVSGVIRAFASIFVTATLTIILMAVYFDMTVAMNSPHKILGAFALMSSMLFSLCETRVYLKKTLPRTHFAFCLLTFMLGASFALSSAIYVFTSHASEFISNPITLGNIAYVAVIIAVSVYAISRSFSFEDAQTEII